MTTITDTIRRVIRENADRAMLAEARNIVRPSAALASLAEDLRAENAELSAAMKAVRKAGAK